MNCIHSYYIKTNNQETKIVPLQLCSSASPSSLSAAAAAINSSNSSVFPSNISICELEDTDIINRSRLDYNKFCPLKSSLHRPIGPRKSPQLEFVEVRNCHCCCRLLHLNPMAVYRLLLSWANAEVSSQGVEAKRQNSTSFGSAETKNNKCTTRQPGECIRAFIKESGDTEVLELHVQDSFHRLLLHGFSESKGMELMKMMRIKKKKAGSVELPNITLCQFLKMVKEGIW
ncbi:unnamed protein product [Camellia sinensis]